MKKLLGNKLIIILLEVIVLVLLLTTMLFRMKNNNEIVVSMEDMTTEFDGMTFDGKSWILEAEDANDQVDSGYLLYGPNCSLKRGTYTAVINYKTTRIQKGVLEVDRGCIDTADYFMLSNNKNETRYDFKLTTDVDGFKFRLKQYNGGYFELDNITIIRNTHDLRTLFFILVVLFVAMDLLMFNEKVKANKDIIIAVLIVGVIASIPLFFKNMMTGNDIRFHFTRIESIVEGVKTGEIPVKMYSAFNDAYGLPVGIYYGDLLLYLAAFFRLVGFTCMQSYKLYIFVINVFTAGLACYCGLSMFKKKNTALLFTFVYTVGNYRLLCVYPRAAVGEFTACAFYLLIILAIWNMYTQEITAKEYKKNSLILALGMAGLVYTHILSTEMVILVLIVLALCLFKKTFRKETLLEYLKAIAYTALFSSAFIVPFLEYYLNVDTNLKASFQSSYIQKYGAFISDYFSVFKSITGEVYSSRGLHSPGFILMASLIVGISLLTMKKADKRIQVTTVGAIVCLWVSSNIFPWDFIYGIPYMGQTLVSVQFPYRYLGMAACFLAILLGLCIEKSIELEYVSEKSYVALAALTLTITCFFIGAYTDEAYSRTIFSSYDTADQFIYTRGGEFGMYMGDEYLIQGSDTSEGILDYGVYGENVKASFISEKGEHLEVFADAKDNATLELPRFAYPHVIAKDKDGNILKTKRGNNNKLTVLFPKAYTGEVFVDFVEPWYWRLAEVLSLISVIGVVVIGCIRKKSIRMENALHCE